MQINHFQIENKKIQVEILGFFVWSARYGTNKKSRKISCYNDFEKKEDDCKFSNKWTHMTIEINSFQF
jgi:hypothetical protein